MSKRARPRVLTMGQHLAIAGTQAFFEVVTSAIRVVRGTHPEGWRTLRYGLHREEILDVMSPRNPKAARKAVVYFHGGGWMMGTKDFYSHDLLFLAQAGHAVFNVEYPKSTEHPHPWLLRSVFKALAFIHENFPDAREVHFAGDSAGGNLAVMVGILISNPELLKEIDPAIDPLKLPWPVSVISMYGVMDRLTCLKPNIPVGSTMIECYGGKAALEPTVDAAHAITPMDLTFAKHPPCFLLCGEWDPLLPSTEMYEKRLADGGYGVETKIYKKATHGFFNFPDNAVKRNCQRDLVAFLKEIER